MRRLKYYMIFFIVIVAGFGNSGCSVEWDGPIKLPCTYQIPEPLGYDCYLNHNNTGRKIKLAVDVLTLYYSGNSSVLFGSKTIVVDPSVTPFPLSITVDAPNRNPYEVVVNIRGEECSTCANYTSVSTETPYGTCPPFVNPGNPPTYIAAKPRWQRIYNIQTYHPMESLIPVNRITNVPNSCGCTVQ